MKIEIFHKGRFVKRVFVDLPEPDERLDFKERVIARQQMIENVLADFKANTLPNHVWNVDDVHLAVIMESKMNYQVEPERVIERVVPVLEGLFKHEEDIKEERPRIKKKVIKEKIQEPKPTYVRHKGVYSNPQFIY